jgi:pimeloyl-ACP methyl ester carboxylesterase
MPVCRVDDININYRVYGEGFPLVLIHPFSASLGFWAQQIEKLSPKYRIIAYDVRGHGLSSAPAGEENYTLDILVEDLHNLLTHLGVAKAYVGGLSMGGAIALGYAGRYPGTVKALLIFDIHGGFQPPSDAAAQGAMAEGREKGERYAQERGMADFARRQIATGTAFPPVPEDEAHQEQYVERMARFPVNGYIGVGRAKPWEAEWQRQAADKINVPTLITVGSDDLEMVVSGTRILHEHIKGSRYVVIKGSVHETARWRPGLFNQAVTEFLKAVDAGKPVAGEMTLG